MGESAGATLNCSCWWRARRWKLSVGRLRCHIYSSTCVHFYFLHFLKIIPPKQQYKLTLKHFKMSITCKIVQFLKKNLSINHFFRKNRLNVCSQIKPLDASWRACFCIVLIFFETVVRWWSSTFTHQHPECLIFVFPLRLYPLNVTLITHTQNVSSRLNKNSSLSITQNNTNLKFFSQTRQHDVSEFLKLYYFVSSVISLDLSLLVETKNTFWRD